LNDGQNHCPLVCQTLHRRTDALQGNNKGRHCLLSEQQKQKRNHHIKSPHLKKSKIEIKIHDNTAKTKQAI
jgi:hypothetical protein